MMIESTNPAVADVVISFDFFIEILEESCELIDNSYFQLVFENSKQFEFKAKVFLLIIFGNACQ